jgi:pimeloyl-ACP methyl ester carboxylesterase
MSPKKSTIVRLIQMVRLTAVRTAFGTLERLAPALGARWAERLWLEVPPYRGRTRPDIPPGTPFTVTVRDRTVHGTTWGAGPVVYLVHGWAGAAAQLLPFVTPLVGAGHKVVAFDALSHGASDAGELGPRHTTIPEMTRALSAVVKEHGQPHAVIAHSVGCSATFFALRGGLRPSRLVFLAPMAQPTPMTMVFAATLGFGERIRTGMIRRVEERAGAPWADFEMPPLVNRISPPPLLTVHDPADRVTRFADSVALAKVWPDATMVSVPGKGHRGLLRDPGTVARAVEFVAEADSVAGQGRSA